MLEIKDLSVWINDKKILDNINLRFNKGVYVIKGPNGSGKSTLLRTIAGYSYKFEGEIYLNSKNITNLTIYERVKEGIVLVHQIPPRDVGVYLRDLIRLLDKKKFIKKKVEIINKYINRKLYEEFSGGEAKLVDFLISYSLNPTVFLIDEIDSGLDEKNIELVGNMLKDVKDEKIIILTTHTGKILNYLKPKEIIVLENGKIKNIRKT